MLIFLRFDTEKRVMPPPASDEKRELRGRIFT